MNNAMFVIVGVSAAAVLLLMHKPGASVAPENGEGIMDSIQTTMDEAAGAVMARAQSRT